MAGVEKGTIGGYNAMLEQQRQVDGECVITTALFDNHDTLLHDRKVWHLSGGLTSGK